MYSYRLICVLIDTQEVRPGDFSAQSEAAEKKANKVKFNETAAGE